MTLESSPRCGRGFLTCHGYFSLAASVRRGSDERRIPACQGTKRRTQKTCIKSGLFAWPRRIWMSHVYEIETERPERGKHTSWSAFLKAHWDSIAATDFFTVEVLTLRGLVAYYVLFVIDLASRTVKIAGITLHP